MTQQQDVFDAGFGAQLAFSGVTATYRAGGTGAGTSITVIFDAEEAEQGYRDEGRKTYSRGTVKARVADVASPGPLDTFEIDSTVYAVEGYMQLLPCRVAKVVSKQDGTIGDSRRVEL